MKRPTWWLLAALVLAGCASPLRATASPAQVVAQALTATSTAKTAHADYTRTRTYILPVDYPWPPATLGMPPHTYQLDLTGSGDAVFPDRFHYTVTLKLGPSFHIVEELISVAGVAYEQDGVHIDFGGGVTPTWSKRNPQNLLPVDPFKTLQSLKDTLPPRDLGDTTIGGARVHHYAMDMDPAKLVAEETAALADPSLQPALQDAILHGSFYVELWIGTDDHRIRRISTLEKRNEAIALLRAEGNLPLTPTASNQGVVAMSDQFVLNLQDFNKPVTITVPAHVS